MFTQSKTKLTAQDVAAFNAQYPQLDVKYTNVFHDRFMILDGKTVYHIGASLKDAGKKCFGITLMKDAGSELMKKLAKTWNLLICQVHWRSRTLSFNLPAGRVTASGFTKKVRCHLQGAANKKIARRFNAPGDFLR